MCYKLKSCCFGCCSLKTGTLVVGCLALIAGMVLPYLKYFQIVDFDLGNNHFELQDGNVECAINVVISITYIVSAILVLAAVHTDKLNLVIPWLIMQMMFVVFEIAFLAAEVGYGDYMGTQDTVVVFVRKAVIILVGIYSWMIVYGYCNAMVNLAVIVVGVTNYDKLEA